jgi:hypothetical protein
MRAHQCVKCHHKNVKKSSGAAPWCSWQHFWFLRSASAIGLRLPRKVTLHTHLTAAPAPPSAGINCWWAPELWMQCSLNPHYFIKCCTSLDKFRSCWHNLASSEWSGIGCTVTVVHITATRIPGIPTLSKFAFVIYIFFVPQSDLGMKENHTWDT